VLIENVSISYADQFVSFDSQSTSCSNFICAGKIYGKREINNYMSRNDFGERIKEIMLSKLSIMTVFIHGGGYK
jgi:hypothetical protein